MRQASAEVERSARAVDCQSATVHIARECRSTASLRHRHGARCRESINALRSRTANRDCRVTERICAIIDKVTTESQRVVASRSTQRDSTANVKTAIDYSSSPQRLCSRAGKRQVRISKRIHRLGGTGINDSRTSSVESKSISAISGS